MKKNFDISLVDPLSFVGSNDKNIKLIENNFSTNIVIRGNKVKLDGDKNEIQIISKILNNMLYTVEKKGYVEECDVQNLIDTIKGTSIENNIQNHHYLTND